MTSSSQKAIVNLVRAAFPGGISYDEYVAVLAHLYPHAGHRVLAAAIAEVTSKPFEQVLQDVVAAGTGRDTTSKTSTEALVRLRQAGFEAWIEDQK